MYDVILIPRKIQTSATMKFVANSQPPFVCDKLSLLSNEWQQINAE